MISELEAAKFWKYLEFYPFEDDPDYDGIHSGGIKGIRDDAPDDAKSAFLKFQEELEDARKKGIKL